MNNERKSIIFVMGVSGAGKTVIGRLLANDLNIPFIDADDHHPFSNIEKMKQGIPLDDADRMPWLDRLYALSLDHAKKGCVIACSSLKESYRKRLTKTNKRMVQWVYLKGSFDLIYNRIQKRKGHFMAPQLLKSQFDTLEEPTEAITIDITVSPQAIVQQIKEKIR